MTTPPNPRTSHFNSDVEKCGNLTIKDGVIHIENGTKMVNGQEVPATHKLTTGYKKTQPKNPEKEFKTTIETYSQEDLMIVNPNKEIRQYDAVFVVDTNTKIEISVSVMIEVVFQSNKMRIFPALVFNNKSCPEKYGWRKYIEMLVNSESYRNKSIALIVDHDLGGIPEINSGVDLIVTANIIN